MSVETNYNVENPNYSRTNFRGGNISAPILAKPIETVDKVISGTVDTFVKTEENEEKKKSKEKLLNTISKRSQEEREKISKKISDAQKRYKEKNPEEYRKAKQKAAHASRLSQGNYKKTKIEEKVEEWLKNNNINYDYSCIIGSGENCFQYDFIIHGKRILIEVQGDYWHGNPDLFNDDGTDGKRMFNEIQIKKKEIDIIKKKFAENKKFKVLYIWENEINNNNFK